MDIGSKIQKNNYFEYRNVSDTSYKGTKLPAWIKSELPDKDIKILDYGCGFGQIITALKNDGYNNAFGVDIETTVLEYCTNNNLEVKKLNLENLTNPYSFKFDVIILSHIIEHIPKAEIINTLIFIKNNFLVEGGKLLIAVPNAQSNTGGYWMYEDWTHTTLFTSGSLYYVLKAAGFESVEFLDINCFLGRPKWQNFIRGILLKIYTINKNFWNNVTGSAYHKPSPQIFSYEIKAKAF